MVSALPTARHARHFFKLGLLTGVQRREGRSRKLAHASAKYSECIIDLVFKCKSLKVLKSLH